VITSAWISLRDASSDSNYFSASCGFYLRVIGVLTLVIHVVHTRALMSAMNVFMYVFMKGKIMSFWDQYWDQASVLREEFIVSLRSETDTNKLAAWINHLSMAYEYPPVILDGYSSKEEALFHLVLEHLGLLEGSESHRVNALELSNLIKIWPKFKEYCEASCVGDGAWAQLKFKQPIEHGDGFDLIKEALTIIE